MKRVMLSPMEEFRHRVAQWSRRLRAQPRQVVVMRMTRKWASCSTRGRMCFARELLELPPRQQDYVIVHELLHLRHPNHGKVFHAMLSAYVPRWKTAHVQLARGCVNRTDSSYAAGLSMGWVRHPEALREGCAQ